MINCALLEGRAVLAVEGEDARCYLQGLITNDIQKVSGTHAIFAALLSPQGKYLFDFFIIERDGVLLLETDKARLPDLIKRLTMYRLRAKVSFAELAGCAVVAFWEEACGVNSPHAIMYDDPRLPELGQRMIYTQAISSESLDVPMLMEEIDNSGIAYNPDDYEAHRLSLGVPEGGKDLIVDRSILLEYGYDHLHAIDFTKGCYVGQEVTARSKHRATLHKYIHQVTADTPLPPAGTAIVNNGRELGDMRSSKGMLGLAVLRTEDAALSQNMLAGDVAIRAHLPRWIAS